MAVHISTHEYLREHGKPPRGKGFWRGFWAFQISGDHTPYVAYGSYRDAKKAARQEAVKRGKTYLTVLP